MNRIRLRQGQSVRYGAVIAALSLALLCLDACSRKDSGPRIALITPLTTTEIWKGLHAGAYKACKESSAQLYWNGPTDESDSSRQVELVERQVQKRATGIVLAAAHASALISAVAAAQRQHIPVVLAGGDLAIPMGAGVAVVKSDDTSVGRMAAEYIASHAAGKEVAVIGIDPANSSSLARVASFEAALRLRPALRLVEKNYISLGPFNSGEDDPARVLERHPKLAAIFAPTVAAARQAHAALQQKNLLGKVVLVMCGQDLDSFDAMRRGEIHAIIAENVFQIGYLSVRQLLSAAQHGVSLENQTVQPLLITRQTLDDPATQSFLRPYKGFDR